MAFEFKTFLKRITIAIIIAAVLSAIIGTYFLSACYSNGQRVGIVNKFSKKGNIFKTYEGELMQRALSTTGDTWLFSVKDEAVAREIENAMNQGARVSIQYCEKYYVFPWEGDTGYFIEKVTVVNQQAN